MRPPPSEAYLADYARRFELPLLLDTRAEVVEPAEGGGFLARTNRGTISARHVVVATGPFSRPAVPAAGEGLDAEVVQLHSAEYQRPSDIGTGDVLVFGGGNSAVVPAGRDPRDQPVLVARDLVSRLAAGELSHRTGQQPLAYPPPVG